MVQNIFNEEELQSMRAQFAYVDCDYKGDKRVFLDNAGGSLRLRRVEEVFKKYSEMPDASEHTNKVALELLAIEDKGREDIKNIIFNAKEGVIYPSYTASQIMMETVRVLSENATGTNVVTSILEHPSAFDAMTFYAHKHNRELRVAKANPAIGGVSVEDIISLVDKDTAILSCMAASNISGYIYKTEEICKQARKINPNILIICDAVQHAPHAALDPEKWGVDVMNYAPYKFFGVRGFGVAYLSNRVASFEHHKLLEAPADAWDLGSPAPAHFAAISETINYVSGLGAKTAPNGSSKRVLFEHGMNRIAAYERFLLQTVLEGTNNVKGLRYLDGIKIQMDSKNLEEKDLIFSVEFKNMDAAEAAKELDKRGFVVFERLASSSYSKRMIEAFDKHCQGVVRVSPLHVNTVEEMEQFIMAVEEVSKL